MSVHAHVRPRTDTIAAAVWLCVCVSDSINFEPHNECILYTLFGCDQLKLRQSQNWLIFEIIIIRNTHSRPEMSFKIANRTVGGDKSVYVIAEIGQNHQGDIEIAKRMILAASAAGADCVKFQKSCLNEKFTKAALARRYDGPNSWGRTYGAHKEHLEFNVQQYKLLQQFAHDNRIEFTASAMDVQSLRDLMALHVPVIKIGSGDANNMPMLREVAKSAIPLIISTGMQDESMVDRIVGIMNGNGKTDYCLMHCVSAYPTAPENVQLHHLTAYRKRFRNICIGYSGHEQGTAISTAAVALGAKVFLL